MVIYTVHHESIFFVFFIKHNCPQCGERLERSYIWEMLPPKSKEAQRYRVIGDTTLMGISRRSAGE